MLNDFETVLVIQSQTIKDLFGKRSLIQSFCKTWTHPYISELDEYNKLKINIKHKESEDNIYQASLEQAESLIQCDHPYHTSNH